MDRSPDAKETQGLIARVVWLDAEIREGRYPNLEALQETFSIGRRTANNAVAFLRDSLGAPLEYDRKRRGYYYADATYALPTVFLEEDELIALFLAQMEARQYGGAPVEAALRETFRKLCRYLPGAAVQGLGETAEFFQFRGGAGVDVPGQLLRAIWRAMRDRRRMRLLYHSLERDDLRERTVEPHFLRNVRGDWMLVAWDDWRQGPREFMLTRVREYALLDGRFTRRAELRPDVYARHVFLTERGREPYGVLLRFDTYQSRWIRERTWHASQVLEELPDGGLRMRLTVSGEGDLLRWVLSMGSHVEVLEPEGLRQKAAAEAERMARQYRDGSAGSMHLGDH